MLWRQLRCVVARVDSKESLERETRRIRRGDTVGTRRTEVDREPAVVTLRVEEELLRLCARLHPLGCREKEHRERLAEHGREVTELAAIAEATGVLLK